MGSGEEESSKPVHTVIVKDFFIGKFPVTFIEFIAYCEFTGYKKLYDKDWPRGKHPLLTVSWQEAQDYCQWLTEITKNKYRLPREAEWEFAARGGNLTSGFKYSGGDRLSDVGWFWHNSDNQVHQVGEKKPNELGIHDMSGNVYEWCLDYWHPNYYGAPTDGSAWLEYSSIDNPSPPRVSRGGSYYDSVKSCTVAHRWDSNGLISGHVINGFRVVCEV